MLYGACCVPVSPVKKEPSHTSEMVSQLIFGERCTLLETFQGDWIKIQGKADGYVGWCHQSHLVNIDEDEFEEKRLGYTQKWISQVVFEHQTMQLPLGSCLAGCKKGKGSLGSISFHYHGRLWWPGEVKVTGKKIEKFASEFINTPYLWGGKTVFGIDCSGFSQAVYKFFNIHLPRDSWQQAEMGELVSNLEKAKRGDLIFFDNPQGKIVHVGILLKQNKIIHSSGKVRIDKIDNEGIINLSTGKRTHHLASIRRYVTG
jgi:hypothetical protein